MTPPPLRSVPVLMYHEIRESAKATWPKLAVSPDAFTAQLAYLSDAGYTTLTASALASSLAKGGKVLPRHSRAGARLPVWLLQRTG
jgi:hypothetical protein